MSHECNTKSGPLNHCNILSISYSGFNFCFPQTLESCKWRNMPTQTAIPLVTNSSETNNAVHDVMKTQECQYYWTRTTDELDALPLSNLWIWSRCCLSSHKTVKLDDSLNIDCADGLLLLIHLKKSFCLPGSIVKVWVFIYFKKTS